MSIILCRFSSCPNHKHSESHLEKKKFLRICHWNSQDWDLKSNVPTSEKWQRIRVTTQGSSGGVHWLSQGAGWCSWVEYVDYIKKNKKKTKRNKAEQNKTKQKKQTNKLRKNNTYYKITNEKIQKIFSVDVVMPKIWITVLWLKSVPFDRL